MVWIKSILAHLACDIIYTIQVYYSSNLPTSADPGRHFAGEIRVEEKAGIGTSESGIGECPSPKVFEKMTLKSDVQSKTKIHFSYSYTF